MLKNLLISIIILLSLQPVSYAGIYLTVTYPNYLAVNGVSELYVYIEYKNDPYSPTYLPFGGSLILKTSQDLISVSPSKFELKIGNYGTFKYSATLKGIEPGTETLMIEVYDEDSRLRKSLTLTIPVILTENYVDIDVKAPEQIEKGNVETIKVNIKNKMLNKTFGGLIRVLGTQSVISPETAIVNLNPMESKQLFFSLLIPENATGCEENVKVKLYSEAGEVLDSKDLKFNFCKPPPPVSTPSFEITQAIYGLIAAAVILSILGNRKK